MDLTKYRVKRIIYPYGEYRLGNPVPIIDECSFYRIDGTHIFDKHRILSIEQDGDEVKITMKDKVVALEVVQ